MHGHWHETTVILVYICFKPYRSNSTYCLKGKSSMNFQFLFSLHMHILFTEVTSSEIQSNISLNGTFETAIHGQQGASVNYYCKLHQNHKISRTWNIYVEKRGRLGFLLIGTEHAELSPLILKWVTKILNLFCWVCSYVFKLCKNKISCGFDVVYL